MTLRAGSSGRTRKGGRSNDPKTVPARSENHPAFGMWKRRKGMADPGAFVRRLRAPRQRRARLR